MVEQLINTKRSNLKRKENDMGDMSWLSHLVTTGAKEELTDFLKDKGFRKPKFAAEQFLKAQEEIERDGMKRKEKELNDGEPTTADEHNNKWLKENK
jgi:hypothetical protein